MWFREVTCLHVHSLNHSKYLSACVADVFTAAYWFETFTELSEILARLGTYIVEKLDHNLGWECCTCVYLHIDVTSSRSFINCFSLSISCSFFIDECTCAISVSEFIECPVHELLVPSNINLTVKVHDGWSFVEVSLALHHVLSLLEERIPLSWEELHVGHWDKTFSL